VELLVPSELMELYSVVRSHESVDLKSIKNVNPNPSIIKNNTTKNGKTSLATPIIMAKYFPYDGNARKNIKNLKVNNKIEIAISSRGGL
jgi:plastocyanin domain-containing protein